MRRNCDPRLRFKDLNPFYSPAHGSGKKGILQCSDPKVSSPVPVPPRPVRPRRRQRRVETEKAVVQYEFFIKLVETRHNYDCSALTPSEMRNLVINLGYPIGPADRIAELANKAIYSGYMPTVEEIEQMKADIRYFE